jgi:hypothetical protein
MPDRTYRQLAAEEQHDLSFLIGVAGGVWIGHWTSAAWLAVGLIVRVVWRRSHSAHPVPEGQPDA